MIYERELLTLKELETNKKFYDLTNFRHYVVKLLNKYSVDAIYTEIDNAIVFKADVDEKVQSGKFLEHSIHYSEMPDVEIIQHGNIAKLEQSCLFIQRCLNSTDLKHQERTYLLFIYSRCGDNGINRFKEIMKRQRNYKEYTTNYQIQSYLDKKKLIRLSCKKIIKEGLCHGCESNRLC